VNVRAWGLPFRVGATSYVIEDDLLPNARYLAPIVQDMQLVLFDLPGGPSNLPDAATAAALAEVGRTQDLTYTVHLLDDLRCDPHLGDQDPSLHAASRVVDLTRSLAPWAWVGHLDGRAMHAAGFPAAEMAGWHAQAARAVETVDASIGAAGYLAVENLEGYPGDFVSPVVERTGAARCVDVGHLWLDGCDPLTYLDAALPRCRVVHLHGVAARDHASLTHTPPDRLDSVVHRLIDARYAGVLTLEVFGGDDFWSSLAALEESVQRYRG